MLKDSKPLIIGLASVFTYITMIEPADAAPKAPPRALSKLIDCRLITDSTSRLACYDEQVAAIESATQKDEVVVMDKEDVRQTRRSLFGFSIPKLPFLGGGDGQKDAEKEVNQITQIDDTIKNLRAMPYGIWVLTLDDGSQWQTADPMPYGTPKPGLKVVINRAALNSYKISVNNWPAVKVKRVG